jgi:hypothetical protein
MSLSDTGVDVSRCSSLVVFAALFRRPSTKVEFRLTHPVGHKHSKRHDQIYASQEYAGWRRKCPLEVPEDRALPYRCFLPHDGLRIAGDKVLGKLFLRSRLG